MIAYNETDLKNLALKHFTDKALRSNLISLEEQQKISFEHPVKFYSPNVFLRIGLGILTSIVSSAVMGLLFLVSGSSAPEFIALLMGLVSIILLEMIIHKWHHYRSGIDDVLLHTGIFYLITFFLSRFDFSHEIIISGIALLLYLFAFLRYLDRLSAILAIAALISLIYQIFQYWFEQPGSLVLFIIAATLALVAVGIHLLQKKPFFIHHHQVFQLLKYASIIACYASLHYYVVDQYFQAFTTLGSNGKKPVFPGWFHLIWTFIVPLGMLSFGFVKKDRPWIRIGLALMIAFFFFWQYQFHPIDHDIASVLYGIGLAALAYFVINYLKTNNSHFTDEAESADSNWQWVEPLAISAGFSTQASTSTNNQGPGTNFGEGNFGGGGAEGHF